ncbi:hypothetical protein ABZ839_09255 [Streptomyces cellulosae]
MKRRTATGVSSCRVEYENVYRLCDLRGPSGIIVALAERIG